MPKLTYTLDGQEHTHEVGDSCSIGRAPTNDVALESEAGASRRHVQIMKLAKSYELTDLGSTNGTKVNGKKVQRHKLEHGDRIEIGETALVWKERDDDEIDIEEEISFGDDKPAARKGATAGDQSYLVFAGGGRDGERIALDKQRTTFGRRSSNTVAIESQAVSGYHCEITREGGSYVLRDLGSTNGTMLDGEPVTEIALQHGGRIRIGDQLMVFVDPSISDFEKAMAAVDDLGSEWGMLRAEMDMTRVQRARRSQMLAVVAVLVVIGVIGYVFIANPELLEEPQPTIAQIEGNEVEDFSFEMLSGGWTALPGSPTAGTFGSGDGAQGSSFYTVTRDGPLGRPAVAELTEDDISVSPVRTYRFGAQVRTSGGGRAVVRIRWIGAGEGVVGTHYSATGVSDAGGWAEVSATVKPPANTTAARLQLLNVGSGSADFDDLFLVPTGDGAGGAEVTDGELVVAANGEGALTIKRGSDVLLDDLRVVGGAMGGAADRNEITARVGTATVSSVSSADGGVRVRGSVYDPYTEESGDFELTFTPSGGRYVEIAGSLPPTAGLVGIVPENVIEKGVGVWTSTASFRESQTRFVQAAERVSIGSSRRYEVSGGEGTFRFALLTDGGARALAFGSSDGTIGLRLDGATRELDRARDALRDAAQAAETQERFGEAIEQYESYASEFPEGSVQQEDARRRAAALREKGAERVAGLRVAAEGAIAYGEVAALRSAVAEAAALHASYGVAEAQEIRQRLETALEELRTARAQSAAAPQLARATDHLAGGRKALARALYRDVIARFPGTEAASAAEQALGGLGE